MPETPQLLPPKEHFFARHIAPISVLGISLLMMLVGTMFYTQREVISDNQRWVFHTYDVLSHIQVILAKMKDAQLGHRGFVATGDEWYLRPYYQALNGSKLASGQDDPLHLHYSIEQEWSFLRRLTVDNVKQTRNLLELKSKTDELLAYQAHTIELRKQIGSAAIEQTFTGEGQRLMDSIESTIHTMAREETQLLEQRIDSDKSSIHFNNRLIFIGLLLFYVVAATSAIMISRHNRVRKLMEREVYVRAQQVADANSKLHIANQTLERLNERTKTLAQSRLSAVVDNTFDGLVTFDALGRIESFNPACTRLFQYAPEEATGKGIAFLMPSLASEQGSLFYRWERGEISHEVIGRRKDGTEFPIELSISSFDLEDGPHFSAILRDITERKQAEKEREKLIERLTGSNEELGRFAYVASHDLKEPLRMVTSFTSLLAKRYKDQLDAQAQEYITYAKDGAERMQMLVDDLLEYARVSNQEDRLERVDCNRMMEVIRANLTMQIHDSGAEIASDPLPTIHANGVRMTMLLQNLISNGIKYQEAGKQPRIEVSAQEEGAFWKFSVKDNGIGMKEEYLMRIFEPFRRLHTKETYRGTGIGLAICAKIVENWGGKIWATSELGIGSTMHFILPKDPTNLNRR